jgi:hypothetical protein
MGREIRRVPPNWEHPKEDRYDHRTGTYVKAFKALYGQSCEEAWRDWIAEYQKWLDGEQDRIIAKYEDSGRPKDQPYTAFCMWHGQPPDPERYRPHWQDGEATWYQLYETVSEGTPVTPPFATAEELIDYLAEHGDYWDQERCLDPHSCELFGLTPGKPGWGRKQAEGFVRAGGYAPSMVIQDGRVMSGVAFVASQDHQ